MKISTVTVCYNARATIGHTVKSFLHQRHADKELIVIDGGSRDNTVEIVKRFDDPAIRIISEKDGGIYDAMNKGLEYYRGDAIGFLNADDAYHDDMALSRIALALEAADAAYGDLVMVSDHESRKIVRQWQAGPFTPGAFRRGWMPPHPTFYIRRELAKKAGLFDLSYSISADYDFMLRVMELHARDVRYIPHILVDFMVGGVSTTGLASVIRGNLECLRSRQRHLGAPLLDAALFTKPLRKIFQITTPWAKDPLKSHQAGR